MGKIRLLVLDVLKPHAPSILELASKLSDLKGLDGVNITVYEIDSHVENIKITVRGKDIKYESVLKLLKDAGATVHSIDKVSCGDIIIREVPTPQDRRT